MASAALDRGIGRGVAAAFAGEGARVFGVDIAAGEEQPGVTLLQGDVSDEAQVRAILEQVGPSATRAIMSEPGGEAYGASKGGLLALTHALANSLGPAIRVNAIVAGWIV